MKKVLIFGASDFLGSDLVAALLGQGQQVTAITRSYDADDPDKFDPRVKWVQADLYQADQWQDLLDQTDVVIDLVGSIREDPEKGLTYQHVIVDAAQVIAKTTQAAQPQAQMIFVSSNLDATSTPEGYRKAKAEAESLIKSYLEDVVIIRPTMMYGPGRQGTTERAMAIRDKMDPNSPAWDNRPIPVAKVAQTISDVVTKGKAQAVYEVKDMDK